MSNGRQQKRHYGPNIRLEATWNKAGDSWLITATATVRYGRNGLPDQPEEVDLMIQGTRVNNDYTEIDSGTVTFEEEVPGPGRYNVRVQLTEYGGYSSRPVTIPNESKKGKKPDKLDVRDIGSDGEYDIVVRITDEMGAPVPDWFVEVFDDTELVFSGNTDENGVIDPPHISFDDKYREVIVRAGFATRELNLSGPVRKRKLVSVRPNPRDLEGGFFTALHVGWESAKIAESFERNADQPEVIREQLDRMREAEAERRTQKAKEKAFSGLLKAIVKATRIRSKAEVAVSRENRRARESESKDKRRSAEADARALETYSRATVVAEKIRAEAEIQKNRETHKSLKGNLKDERAHEKDLLDKRLKNAAETRDRKEVLRRSELANSLEIARTESGARRHEVDGEVRARIGEAKESSRARRAEARASSRAKRSKQRTKRSLREIISDLLDHSRERRRDKKNERSQRRNLKATEDFLGFLDEALAETLKIERGRIEAQERVEMHELDLRADATRKRLELQAGERNPKPSPKKPKGRFRRFLDRFRNSEEGHGVPIPVERVRQPGELALPYGEGSSDPRNKIVL